MLKFSEYKGFAMSALREACAKTALRNDVEWQSLEGATVLITGATGLIGSLCVKTLMERNIARSARMSVIAPVRSKAKAERVFSDYGESDELTLVELEDIANLDSCDLACADYVIHAACPTSSRFFQSSPVETLFSIIQGTKSVLEYALKSESRSVVYVSSMEVYGSGNAEAGLSPELTVKDVGYVDPLEVRSCYPEGKRAAECLCTAYASEYGLPVKIARLAQTFGPGVDPSDSRLFMYLVKCALEGEDIRLKTSGQSTRMYCHTLDAVSAILFILLKGACGQAYNAANQETYISVLDLAQHVADNFAVNATNVVVDIDRSAPFPPEHHLPLDTTPLKRLGWKAAYSLDDMFDDMIRCFQ